MPQRGVAAPGQSCSGLGGQLPGAGAVVELLAGVDEQGPDVEALGGEVDRLLHVGHGQGDVLEDLLHEGEAPHALRGRQLHEGHIEGQQPPEEVAEERVVAIGDHELDDPEDGSSVPEDVVPDGDELLAGLSLVAVALDVLVPPGLVPPGEGIDAGGARRPAVVEVTDGENATVLGKERGLAEGGDLRRRVERAAALADLPHEVLLALDRDVLEADVGLDGDDLQLQRGEHAQGPVAPGQRAEKVRVGAVLGDA
mmetsp:Transcript_142534/g.443255  ORF Transcript_142534/g.443255 Transcript_142534/m.443255 type:complete len:254 (+) Transcript_142534:375-1136(+)